MHYARLPQTTRTTGHLWHSPSPPRFNAQVAQHVAAARRDRPAHRGPLTESRHSDLAQRAAMPTLSLVPIFVLPCRPHRYRMSSLILPDTPKPCTETPATAYSTQPRQAIDNTHTNAPHEAVSLILLSLLCGLRMAQPASLSPGADSTACAHFTDDQFCSPRPPTWLL